MRIWVFGGGSLGLLYAAKLSAAGCEVRLVTRTSSQAQAISAKGIGVTTELVAGGGRQVIACPAISVEELVGAGHEAHTPPDWILLTVKQYGLNEQVISTLASLMTDEFGMQSKLLAMQNGIGHMEELAKSIAKPQLYAAVISEGALRTSPTEVVHTGFGMTKLGASYATNYQGAEDDEGLKQLQNVLHHAGFQTLLSKQLNIDIWQKVIINSVINPLTALLQIRNGALLEHSSLTEIMHTLCKEALTTAERAGIHLQLGEVWKLLMEVCRNTAGNKSSMLQDLEAGRPTEVRWINGAIERAAEYHGVDVPTHSMMVRLVQAREEIR